MDALGSLRGVVNPTGEVLEGKDYTPYGSPYGHTGTAQTAFGFTGEATDPNELLNLRARNYLPGLGVFPSLDLVEEGNRYGYVGGNPVNYTDHTGTIPDRSDIQSQQKNDPKYIYSCNCGWIDWRHANPDIVAKRAINYMSAALACFKKIPRLRVVGIRGTDVQHQIGIPFPDALGGHRLRNTFTDLVIVTSALSDANYLNAAMELFRAVEEGHEGDIASMASLPLQSRTYYSEEDLTSDLIAFYRALDPHNWNHPNAFDTLAPICGYPKDFNQARQWSLDVFATYPGYQIIYDWESPRLTDSPAICQYCTGNTRQWPSQLSSIQPTSPSDGILVVDPYNWASVDSFASMNPGRILPIAQPDLPCEVQGVLLMNQC